MSTCRIWGQLCSVVVSGRQLILAHEVVLMNMFLSLFPSSPSRSGLKTLLPLCPSHSLHLHTINSSVGWGYNHTQVSDLSPGAAGGVGWGLQVSLRGPSETCLPVCPHIPATAVVSLKGIGTGREVRHSEWPPALVWG